MYDARQEYVEELIVSTQEKYFPVLDSLFASHRVADMPESFSLCESSALILDQRLYIAVMEIDDSYQIVEVICLEEICAGAAQPELSKRADATRYYRFATLRDANNMIRELIALQR